MPNVNRPSTSIQPIGQCWERVTPEKSDPPTRSTHSFFTMAGMQAQCYLILQSFKRSLTYRFLLKIHSLKSFSNNSKNRKNSARVITGEQDTYNWGQLQRGGDHFETLGLADFYSNSMIFTRRPWVLDHSGMIPVKITATASRERVLMLPASWKNNRPERGHSLHWIK